ncbi:MAG: PAS domain-containing protein [Pyrinomonadaceae bacterium]
MNLLTTILVVDDSPDRLELLALVLRRAGYPVETAADGREGLELAHRRTPDLIISDVSMPWMDGIELCRRIRADEKLRLVPIMLLTALRKDSESVLEGLHAGADDYLQAPYEPTFLIAKVERLLARHALEKALKASRQQLQFITDTAPIYIAHCDAQKRYKFVNRGYVERFGVSAEEVVGKRIADVLGAEAYQSIEPYIEIALRGKSVEFEAEVQYEQLGGRYVHVAYAPEFGERGEVEGFVAVVTDVSERRRAEEALRESRQRLVRAQKVAHIGNWDWDVLSGTVVWSDEMYNLHGVSSEDFTPTFEAVLRFIHPDDVGLVNKTLEVVLKEGTSLNIDYRIILPGGAVRTVNAQSEVHTDEKGRAVKVVGTVQDITERKRAEERHTQQEKELAEAQRLAHIGSWSVVPETGVTSWSDEHFRMFGYNPHEILLTPTSFLEQVHPEDRGLAQQMIERALSTGEPFSYYVRIIRRDGELRILHARGEVVRDNQGRPVRMFGTAQDVTEVFRVQERLESTNEQLRALSVRLESAREEEGVRIARELHDELGGALTSLRWDLQSVSQRLAGLEIEAGTRAHVEGKVNSMNELIDSSLDTVRRISSELRPTALDDLGLTAAIEWKARQFQSQTGITVTCHSLPEAEGVSRAQALAVYRILQEALTNVLRHAQATRVDLFLHCTDAECGLKIVDNGRGFSAEDSGGTGSLGLLGMRERAQLVGGELSITSEPGKGTSVLVRVRLEAVTAED